MDQTFQPDFSQVILHSIVEGLPIRAFWKDRDSRYLGCNTLFAIDAGFTRPDELIGKTDFDMGWKDLAEIYRADDLRVMESEVPKLAHEGRIIWVRTSKVPLRDADQNVIGILGVFEDITAHKQAEESQKRLTRALRILSKCNHVLVHVHNEQELLSEICQLVVENGYLMSWVGFAENDAAKTVRPVAQSGARNGYLDRANITWADTERGQGPTGTAIRTGVTVVNQDYLSNPRMAPWRDSAIKLGYQSSAALPLICDNNVLGAFTLYAPEPSAFIPEEVTLLEELANDLAFGIVTLRTKAERDRIAAEHQQHAEILLRSLEDSVKAIAATVEARDPYTSGHQSRVSLLAVAIAEEMGLPDETINGIGLAASVHDLGKISVPAEILSKPGGLTEVEFMLVKQHVQRGYDILKDIAFPWPLATNVWQHHERMDSSGYPQGLKGEQILLGSRILAVADVVEAMASHRPYRPALGIEAALEEIELHRGTRYDGNVVDACIKLFRQRSYKFTA
jgi:PAS domain S-box-containing protein